MSKTYFQLHCYTFYINKSAYFWSIRFKTKKNRYKVNQVVDWEGSLGTITAITADARTGNQESIIVRFIWSKKGFEFKVDDSAISIPEVLPSWMSREGDALNISDRH